MVVIEYNSSMENFLFDAISRLTGAAIDFVVCGGVACILQGSDRNSFDLDICVSLEGENLKKIIRLSKEMQLLPRIPFPIENLLDPKIRQQWIQEKNARVFTLNSSNGLLQIDVFLTYPIDYKDLKNESDTFSVDDVHFKVSSIKHLIKAKKEIAENEKRRQDLYDIDVLQELLKGKDD
jgi:hypothetical protein